MDFATLTGAKDTAGSIRQWVNDSTVPAETILVEAEAWIYERLRVREMQVQAAFQFDAATSSKVLPSDFLDPLGFVPHGWAEPLRLRHPAMFTAPRDTSGSLFSGEPSMWTVFGTTAQVDVTCSSAFAGILTYYGRPAALGVANTTNFITVRYPTLLRRVCMAYAFEFKKDDPRMQAELVLAEQALVLASSTNDFYLRGMQ